MKKEYLRYIILGFIMLQCFLLLLWATGVIHGCVYALSPILTILATYVMIEVSVIFFAVVAIVWVLCREILLWVLRCGVILYRLIKKMINSL